jgi:hypothetical protein
MQPSFQSSTYTHAFQAQIHGPSGLKVFDGEDLSIQKLIKRVAIANESSNYNLTFGGGNRRRRSSENKK